MTSIKKTPSAAFFVLVGVMLGLWGAYTHQQTTTNEILRWHTENELDILGFNLYRGACEDVADTRINDRLIAASGGVQSQAYAYTDTQPYRGVACYQLETVYRDGRLERQNEQISP